MPLRAVSRAPRRTASRSASAQAAGFRVRLMKPGPATSTVAIRSSCAQFCRDRFGEIARLLAGSLASTIAALVAMSPCAGSRGGSTTTRDRSMPAGKTPGRNSASQSACDTRIEHIGER